MGEQFRSGWHLGAGAFFNQATGQVEQWQRRYFTIEENGGFDAGEIHNNNVTFSINTGVKGAFDADWSYEALLGYSQNKLKEKWPVLISAKAQALYLGPSLGTDPGSGYQIYNAPISRLYTPLTVDQFRSITTDSLERTSAAQRTLVSVSTAATSWPCRQVRSGLRRSPSMATTRSSRIRRSLDGTYYSYTTPPPTVRATISGWALSSASRCSRR